MPNQTIPGANQSRRYERNYPGVTQPRITKLVLHSTETPNLPGYVNGATAPTATINPWPGQQAIWQHFPANMSGRALANPTGTTVSENRDDVAQIEIIGYSDSKIAAKYGVSAWDLERLPDEGYAYLANLIAWFCTEWDVPARIPDKPWPAYPASYGNSPARMSGAEYDAYTGILGHLHVSGNDHGDPKIDPVKLLRFVKAAIDPIRPDPKIVELQQELVAAGLLTPAAVDGIDGPTTRAAKEAAMSMLDDFKKDIEASIDRARRDVLAALMIPLNDEGRRVFGTTRDIITTGQALAGMGLAARRSEVVLAIAEAEATEAMRKWASDGGPKPGLDRAKGGDQ